MTALVLRGFAARRLRAVLTALAIVFGVAMITGTYVLTDQINHAFVDIEQAGNQGRDVVVERRPPLDVAMVAPAPLEQSVLTRLRAVPGVAKADGQLWTLGRLRQGDEEFSSGMAPSMVVSAVGEPYNPFELVEGREPRRSREVMVNRELAESRQLRLGKGYQLETRTGLYEVSLVGWFDYGDGASFGGATAVVAPLADVQDWFDMEGKFTSVFAAASSGVAPDELAGRVRAALGGEVVVRTGAEQAADDAAEINDALGSFLTPLLLAFGAAAVLVGAFIIFNTFSITVAQRTREFALLRALGSTRRQILALVAAEAALLGLIASAIGLGAGLGFAASLGALFDAVGMGIPRSGIVLAERTIVAAFAVGIGVTLAAALAPAVRAMRVPPIMAMHGETVRQRGRTATVLSALVAIAGLASLAGGLFGGAAATARMSLMGIGTTLLFVGIALNARHIVRPVAALVGLPLERMFHTTGQLARENAMRNPGRTAATSAALMVGLGLVIFVAVLASGLKASVTGSMDRLVTAELVVRGQDNAPMPAGAAAVVPTIPGVSSTSPTYVDQLKVGREPTNALTDVLNGVNLRRLTDGYDVDWVDGSDDLLAGLGVGDALIEEQFAEQHGVGVGDRFSVASSGGRATLTVAGIYKDPQLLQGTMVDVSTFKRLSASLDPWIVFATLDEGATVDQVKRSVAAALKPFPAVRAETTGEYVDAMEAQLDQLVYLLYALLAMSVVISLFGIANSLFLSIHERTKEFGLLRAIGTTGRQVRRIVRYESVITSVIGGLLGIGVGLLLAWLMTLALADLGLVFSVPVGQLFVFLALAVLVGIAAAVFPARRGARIDVLEALHHE